MIHVRTRAKRAKPALPMFASSTAAATVGAAAAEGSAAAKTAATLGLSGAILGPLIGLLGGWIGAKASLAGATSLEERRLIIRFIWTTIGLAAGSLVVLGLIIAAARFSQASPLVLAVALIGFAIVYVMVLVGLIFRFNHFQRRIRQTAARGDTEGNPPQPARPFVYRSRWTLLGLPLVHIRLGRCPDEKPRPTLGWIAIGDVAIGVLFAAGGVALGGISMGGVCGGLISLGGVALGGLAVGGVVFGAWAVGGAAAGYLALGGCALAWHAAFGGLAVSKHLAIGGVAQAQHANDSVAEAFFEGHPFFQIGAQWSAHAHWLVLGALLPIVLGYWWWFSQRREASKEREAT